ncbi:MAG TPA: hypothetical protein VHF06_14175 [Pseudonocardiaceae bacterium]|jgi:hypothetical protein|nr:hypothetical protein [Pseudonocardiaceae bacterium]
MSKFTDRLWHDLMEEHGETLANAARPEPGRASVLRRPRVLAGGTLGLAAVGTAIALAMGALSGTPAYAVTTTSDGGVLVTINQDSALPDANAKLATMGIHKVIGIDMAAGPAPVSGPVTCTPAPGEPRLSGPPVMVLVGKNGTEVIEPGTTGDNTGVGTWHLAACQVASDKYAGNSGSTGGG